MAIKELWVAGNQTGSSEDGTYANPINTYSTLRSAIMTFGADGLDIRGKSGYKWTDRIPDEHGTYNNVTVRGEEGNSTLWIIDGGRRKTDWVQDNTASATGKTLWRCSSISYSSNGNTALEAGCVSVDDEVIACVHWRDSLQATVTEIAKFGEGFSWNKAGTMYLLLNSGDNPNTLLTEVSQGHIGIRNQYPNAGEFTGSVTNAVYQDLIIKRFSVHGMMPRNQPGMRITRVLLKHIGGVWRASGSYWLGNGIELDGGCSDSIVEDITCDGIEDTAISPQNSSSGAAQNNLTIRRVTATNCGLAVIECVQQTGGATSDGILCQDIFGDDIGRNKLTSKRESTNGQSYASLDGASRTGYLMAHNQNSGYSSTAWIKNIVMERCRIVDAPLAWFNLRSSSQRTDHAIRQCMAVYTGVWRPDHAIQVGRDINNSPTESVITISGTLIRGAVSGVKLRGGYSLTVVSHYNSFIDCNKGLDGASQGNGHLTLKNNVFQGGTAVTGWQSSTSLGGNRVSTGTTAGFTSVGNDQTGQALLTFDSGSAYKPVTGSPAYSGGTVEAGTFKDQLNQNYPTSGTTPRGAYAVYNASNSNLTMGGATGAPSNPTDPTDPGGGGTNLPVTEVGVTGIDLGAAMAEAGAKALGSQKQHFMGLISTALGPGPIVEIRVGVAAKYRTTVPNNQYLTASDRITLPVQMVEPPSINVADALTASNCVLAVRNATNASIEIVIPLKVGATDGEAVSANKAHDGTSYIRFNTVTFNAPNTLDVNLGGGGIPGTSDYSISTLTSDMTLANENNWGLEQAPNTVRGSDVYAQITVGIKRSYGNSGYPDAYISDSSLPGNNDTTITMNDSTSVRCIAWYVAGRAKQSTVRSSNSRVQFRNHKLLALLTNNTWQELGSSSTGVQNASWHANFSSPGNEDFLSIGSNPGSALYHFRNESSGNGGGQSIGSIGYGGWGTETADNGSILNKYSSYTVHGYPVSYTNTKKWWVDNVRGFVQILEARLIIHDANAADDRANANVMIWSGADWYANNIYVMEGAGVGRLKLVTNDWRVFSWHNLTTSLLTTYPPPGFS
jgi:hypothetical protein